MTGLPPVRDNALSNDENVIEEKNAAFLHEFIDISHRAPAYQDPPLTGAGGEKAALAQHVGDKVDSLPVDLGKLIVLVYLTDTPDGVIKPQRNHDLIQYSYPEEILNMEEFLPHCGELPSAHVHLYLVVHFVFNEGVVNRNLPHC